MWRLDETINNLFLKSIFVKKKKIFFFDKFLLILFLMWRLDETINIPQMPP